MIRDLLKEYEEFDALGELSKCRVSDEIWEYWDNNDSIVYFADVVRNILFMRYLERQEEIEDTIKHENDLEEARKMRDLIKELELKGM